MKQPHSFLFHFLFSAAALLYVNALFLFLNHNVPDGRIVFMLPITSVAILLYVVCIGAMSRGFLDSADFHWMTEYVFILSVLFFFLARPVYSFFQDVHFLPISILMIPYVGVFPFSNYFVILGIGLVLYPLFLFVVRKNRSALVRKTIA